MAHFPISLIAYDELESRIQNPMELLVLKKGDQVDEIEAGALKMPFLQRVLSVNFVRWCLPLNRAANTRQKGTYAGLPINTCGES
jgi:hypothetical protein